jgi:hypothetical protein
MLFRLLNNANKPVQDPKDAAKLTATEGVHSLVCRAQKSVNSAMKYLSWIALGNVDIPSFLIMINRLVL